MIRPTIVFDLDGTLADSARDLIATLNVILKLDGLAPVAFQSARDLVGAGVRPMIERGYALNGRTIAAGRLEELYVAFIDHYHAHIADETILFDGVHGALESFASAGWLLAVCTNKPDSLSAALLRTLGVDGLFAAICGKDSFPYFKPDPRHLTMTIRKAGGDPRRAIMVGDSQTDIDTARAAAIPAIGVTFGYTRIPMREIGPDIIIEHFDELWDAAQMVCAPTRSISAAG